MVQTCDGDGAEDRCRNHHCSKHGGRRQSSVDDVEQRKSRSIGSVGGFPISADIPPIKLIQQGMGLHQGTHTNREIYGCWRRTSDFLFTCVAYTIGIHNFFRFPHLCYKFGGVFFIPFILMLMLFGGPIIFLEFSIGQYYSTGIRETFGEIAPILSGISFLLAWNSMLGSLMYTNLSAWMRIYSGVSTSCIRPWERCKENYYYNSIYCYTGVDDDECNNLDYEGKFANLTQREVYKTVKGGDHRLFFNFQCLYAYEFCEANGWTLHDDDNCIDNTTGKTYSLYDRRFHSAKEYFYGSVCGLQRAGYGSIGENRRLDSKLKYEELAPHTAKHWLKENQEFHPDVNSSSGGELFFSAATTWIVFGVLLFEGMLSVGLVSYIVNGIPFVVLLYVTIRALQFDHALAGMRILTTVKSWKSLWTVEIWIEAALQVIITTGIGNGVLISLSSFNKLYHSYVFDTLFILLVNLVTSTCSTIIVFCTIMEYINKFSIKVDFFDFLKVESPVSSVEFGYISYTYFITHVTDERYTILLFFFMITSFNTDSCCRMIQVLMDALVGGLYPRLRRHPHVVLFAVCCMGLMFVMPLTKSGGIILFVDFEYFIFRFFYPSTLLLEVAGICWIYRTRRILDNAELMRVVHMKSAILYLWICLEILCPAILITILVYNVYDYQVTRFNYRKDKILNAYAYSCIRTAFASIPFVLTVLGIISEITNLRNWRDWKSLLTSHEDKHIHAHHHLITHNNLGLRFNLTINHRALMNMGDEARLKQEEVEGKNTKKRERVKKKKKTLVTDSAPVLEKRKEAHELTKKILQRVIFLRDERGKLRLKKYIVEKLIFSRNKNKKLRLKKDVLRKILFRNDGNGKLLMNKLSLGSVLFTNHTGKLKIRKIDLQNLICRRMESNKSISKLNTFLVQKLKRRKRKSQTDEIGKPIVTSEEKLKILIGLIETAEGTHGPVSRRFPHMSSQGVLNLIQMKPSKNTMRMSKKLITQLLLKKIEGQKKDTVFMRKSQLRSFMCHKNPANNIISLKRNQIGKLLFSKHDSKLKLCNYAIRTAILKEDIHNIKHSELNHIKNFLVKAGADVKLWSNSSLFRKMIKSVDGKYRLNRDLITKLRLDKDGQQKYKITKHLLKKVKRRGNQNLGKHTYAKFKLAKYPFDKFNAVNDAYGRLNREKRLGAMSGMKMMKLINVLKFIRKLYRKMHRVSSFVKEFTDHRSKMDIWVDKFIKHIERWPGRLADPADSDFSDESDYEYTHHKHSKKVHFSNMDNRSLEAKLRAQL